MIKISVGIAYEQNRPTGVTSALRGQFGFLAKSALKMRCTKFVFQTKVVKNQNLQLLCYVIFFDILHHYGVIAASQICSVSRKYCAILRNRFLYFKMSYFMSIKVSLLVEDLKSIVSC